MDRDAIARARRRRQAEEALEVERDRMAMLEGEIEDLVTELVGARIDEETYAAMTPEDAETVRELLGAPPDFEVDEDWATDDESADEETAEDDPGAVAEDPAGEIEAEIARLESEIAISRQRQQALERYLAALDG